MSKVGNYRHRRQSKVCRQRIRLTNTLTENLPSGEGDVALRQQAAKKLKVYDEGIEAMNIKVNGVTVIDDVVKVFLIK